MGERRVRPRGRRGLERCDPEQLRAFRSLFDELLGSVLFLLIGIEGVAVGPDARYLLLGLLARKPRR